MRYLIEKYKDNKVDYIDCLNDQDVKVKLQILLEEETNIDKIEIYNIEEGFLSILVEKFGYLQKENDLEETKKYLLEYSKKGGGLK